MTAAAAGSSPSLREQLHAEARLIVATLQGPDGLPTSPAQPVSQAERIRVVGKCCNIIRELNKAKLIS